MEKEKVVKFLKYMLDKADPVYKREVEVAVVRFLEEYV